MAASATLETSRARDDVPSRIIGCDVGKAVITVFDSAVGRAVNVDNTPDALTEFVAAIDDDGLIVCEATGGYEADLLAAATAAGVAAHRADARKVKAFIRSLGRIAKTDAIDAEALARYGLERRQNLKPWSPPSVARDDLKTLVRLRAQLVEQRKALTNQLKAPTGAIAKQRLKTLIDAVTEQIRAIEDDIAKLVEQNQDIARAVNIIEAIPGCGAVTAVTVCALMPELGMLTRRTAASLAGLAPHPNQSGGRNGYRRTRGGRPEVKRALFMAAMSARRHNPQLRTRYQRLIDNGKKPLVALTALMRKLITIINARIRDAAATNPIQLS